MRRFLCILAVAGLGLAQQRDAEVQRLIDESTAQFNQQEGLTQEEKAFGTEPVLSDDDKQALIAFLKTF